MKKKAVKKPAREKSHYLVVARHEMDDLPLAIFDGPNAAYTAGTFAEKCDPMGGKDARRVMNSDASTPVCVIVIRFAAGVPSKIVYQRNIKDE